MPAGRDAGAQKPPRPKRKIRFGVKFKFNLLIILLNLIITGIFSLFVLNKGEEQLRNEQSKRIRENFATFSGNALEFIDEPRRGPWLMSLNPFDPHPPFDPPQEFPKQDSRRRHFGQSESIIAAMADDLDSNLCRFFLWRGHRRSKARPWTPRNADRVRRWAATPWSPTRCTDRPLRVGGQCNVCRQSRPLSGAERKLISGYWMSGFSCRKRTLARFHSVGLPVSAW